MALPNRKNPLRQRRRATLRRVVASLRRVVAGLRRVVAGLRRVVASLRRVVAGLRRVVAGLRRVVAGLRRVVAGLPTAPPGPCASADAQPGHQKTPAPAKTRNSERRCAELCKAAKQNGRLPVGIYAVLGSRVWGSLGLGLGSPSGHLSTG